MSTPQVLHSPELRTADQARPMNTTVRVQLALAALGAGLVHFAVAAGAGLPLAIIFCLCGAAELIWAAYAIARPDPPLIRLVPALALIPLGLWAAALLSGAATAETLPPFALAIAALLDLVVAVGLAASERRDRRHSTAARQPSGLRFTLALIIGALAVSALTLPALGATAAGIAASNGPHATHEPGAGVAVQDTHPGH